MRILAFVTGLACATMSAAMPTAASAQDDAPDLEMWRLDCGTIELSDAAPFSDTHLYDGEGRMMTDSCYLIRNGEQYLLWDAGLPSALKGTSITQWVFTLSVTSTIAEQLAELDLTPADVDMVGISHYHDDHIGQAAEFPGATLVINSRDYAAVSSGDIASAKAQLTPWMATESDGEQADEPNNVTQFGNDHDVFGDGSVTVLAMPGHTPGHSALLVRLPATGPVMLTGDLYHFEEQVSNEGVPAFNTNRADTLASFHRFNQMAENLDATVVIQHDPRHLDRLPTFPESAE